MNHSNKQKTITEVNTDMKKETAKNIGSHFGLPKTKKDADLQKTKK